MSVLDLQSNVISSSAGDLKLLRPDLEDHGRNSPKSSRLREPKDLYSASALQHSPKWPIECQVIPEKFRHVDKVPTKSEPFYMPSNTEPQPKPVGEDFGTLIFSYSPKLSVDYFCRSCPGGSGEFQPFEIDSNTIKFESRFESGNLGKVLKITNVYYELYLRPDMYTDRNSYWFYFRIQNMKENIVYRFSIVNLSKPDSLYKYGLKPLMYSEKEVGSSGIGWRRCGYNITYFKNDPTSEDSLYTLTFNMKFKHPEDTVYLAQCYPYTYSKLQNYLTELESDRTKSRLCQQRLLCKSLAGNNVYVLTITSPENYLDETPKKSVVVLTARVHPAETQSSFMMKGIIDFLTSDSSHAQELRDRFIFKLIPMLNVDGVIVGNSRCCLLGQDLNRQYRTVLREAFPQIFAVKTMLRRLVEENGVFLYCDIHGHSRRNNVFIYGCENRRIPEKRLLEQIFPLMMHKNAADKFSFASCKFKIQRNKEGTGRVFAWTLGVVNSYTLEVSLAGSTLLHRQHTHFNTDDYESIGRHFCETLLDFSDPNEEKEKLRDKILQKLIENGSSAEDPVNITISDYSSLSHSETDSGSESDDEDGETNKSQPNVTNKRPSHSNVNANTGQLKRQYSLRNSKKKIKILPNQNQAQNQSREFAQNISSRLQTKNFTRSRTRNESPSPERNSAQNAQNKNSRRRPMEIDVDERGQGQVAKGQFVDPVILIEPPDTIMGQDHTIQTFISAQNAKCTNLLFDDPFNPPDFKSPRKRRTFANKRYQLVPVPDADGSNSEDECDADGPNDGQNYLQNQFSMLQISPKKSNKLELPSTTSSGEIKKKLSSSEESGKSPRRSSLKGFGSRNSSGGFQSAGLGGERRPSLTSRLEPPNNPNNLNLKPRASSEGNTKVAELLRKNVGKSAPSSSTTNSLGFCQIHGHQNQYRRVSWSGFLMAQSTAVRPTSPIPGPVPVDSGCSTSTNTTYSTSTICKEKILKKVVNKITPPHNLRKWKSLGEKTETSAGSAGSVSRRSSLSTFVGLNGRLRQNSIGVTLGATTAYNSNLDDKSKSSGSSSNVLAVKTKKFKKFKKTRSKKVNIIPSNSTNTE